MNEKATPAIPAMARTVEPLTLEAEPKPLEIELNRKVLIVVDVQNAFCQQGWHA